MSIENPNSERQARRSISRRAFLKSAFVIPVDAALYNFVIRPNQQGLPLQDIRGSSPTLIDTIGDSAVFACGNITSGLLALWAGIPLPMESSKSVEVRNQHPRLFFLDAVAFSPVIEELVFRGLPNSLLKDNSNALRWDVGLPIAMLFAYIHNFTHSDLTTAEKFKKIPMLAFSSGMFLWKIQRERGLLDAILAHVTINLMGIFYKKFESK